MGARKSSSEAWSPPQSPTRATFKSQLEQFAYSPASLATSNDAATMPATRGKKAESIAAGSRVHQMSKSPSSVVASIPLDLQVRKPASRKRSADSQSESPRPEKRSKRTTAQERAAKDVYYPSNKLVDSLRPGLTLVFIGLNPGLETARTGHAYAHRSNHFWPFLHKSGVTLKRHDPSETHALMDLYNIGNTNICARPTRSGAGLTKQELDDGASILEQKIMQHQPEAVAVVGKGVWEPIFEAKMGRKLKKRSKTNSEEEFQYGWQDESLWLGRQITNEGHVVWKGAKTFVTTTTSGLYAGMRPAEKLEIWKPLGEWFTQRREELHSS